MPTDSGVRRRRAGCFWLIAVIVLGLVAGAWFTRTRPILGSECIAVVNGQEHTLEPDQARNAAIISASADRRGLPARAASIAIATAMQESKLRNIDYGDRDSLGLFQQRPSQGWGTKEQILDPIYSTNKFYDALVKIKGYDSMVITEVAQKVQRSAFPDAYGFHEPDARAFASALTGHSPAALTCNLSGANLESQSADSSGFTERASAVRRALSSEMGVELGGSSANTLTVDARSAQQAWAVASWAVASADDLAITKVQVGERSWTRGEKGWSGSGESTRVTINVA